MNYPEATKQAMAGKGAGCVVEPERDTPEIVRAINKLRSAVERYVHLVGRTHDRIEL
jgi:hypothetical protein